MRLRVAFIAVLPAILQAQATSFDVASVKSGKPGAPRGQKMETRRFTGNDGLLGYIETAWNLLLASRDEQDAMLAQMPKWASTEDFEIQAVTRSNLSKDQMRLALRSLLADRFRLQAHTVTEIVPVLALVLDKPAITGPNLRPHSRGEPCDVHSSSHSVGAFPPLCGDVVAVNTAHGAILMGARDVTIDQIAARFSDHRSRRPARGKLTDLRRLSISSSASRWPFPDNSPPSPTCPYNRPAAPANRLDDTRASSRSSP